MLTETSHAQSLAALAFAWRSGSRGASELEPETRGAFASLAPAQLLGAEGLTRALVDAIRHTPQGAAAARRCIAALLDAVRRRTFTERLSPDLVGRWTELVLDAIEGADYTLGEMLHSREQTDPGVVALRVLGDDPYELTVADVGRRTRAIARALIDLIGNDRAAPVAILSENRVEAALVDLACLANGIFDVPIPANAVASQVVYMLAHSGARVLVVSGEEQAAKVLPFLREVPQLRTVVAFSQAIADLHGLTSFEQLVETGNQLDDAAREARAASVRINDLASVMYTSGTTGQPKGISFSQLNVVSKRFCRGFALPHIGEGDVFLAYLPLFHTFGRWFELVGSLYWGATYVFARSPSRNALLEDFRDVKPTVFISVPKKWMELHERAQAEAGTEDPDRVAETLRRIVGGQLRYGVSAAGYLDPVVIRCVRRAGVLLCSGYGMTESTGGITMTPEEDYVENSIGTALPGIDCKVAEDGELLIRGPYVMPGYFRPPDGVTGLDADDWFATGDLVQRNPQGHFRLVGRKKEIYKNRNGQTIAPQRVENLYRDFDLVSQAFLVGDHREYNTLLIWPNYDAHPELRNKSLGELRALLGSLVASANRFLAPYERVVAFEVLRRPLTEENGELTPKGTFKREAIEANWRQLIEGMYAPVHAGFVVGAFELRIPNWVLREMGVLRQDVALRERILMAAGRKLMVYEDVRVPGYLRVGDFHYTAPDRVIDLGALLATPSLWLGNEGLRDFVGPEAFISFASRRREPARTLRVDVRHAPGPEVSHVPALALQVASDELNPPSIHAAAVLLRADAAQALPAVAHLEHGLGRRRSDLAALCRCILRRAGDAKVDEVRAEAFAALVCGEEPAELIATVRRFLEPGPKLLGERVLARICERTLSTPQLETLLGYLEQAGREGELPVAPAERRVIVALMRLLCAYGKAHPVWYARVRIPLARLTMHCDPEIAARAGEELDRLQLGFRAWLGPSLGSAVDAETGREYGWSDVVTFDDSVEPRHRERLLAAMADTSLVREAIFLFGNGLLTNLSSLAPGGIWVTPLGASRGKTVFRLSIQTRAQESFDAAVNLSETLSTSEMREEIRWLLLAGAPPALAEAYGGYFPEHGVFTEEYRPGEDVARQIARLERFDAIDRLKLLWPFHAWTALAVHVAFWERSGCRVAIADPGPSSVIVPSHDYQVGARLVSIANRSPCASVEALLDRFQRSFVEPVESAHPELNGEVTTPVLLGAFYEALGEVRASELLDGARGGPTGEAIALYVDEVRARGYTPRRVHFAALRYARWFELNPRATPEARAAMLRELWGTYGLDDEEKRWPDTRIRFFRRTVFAHARRPVAEAIDNLMSLARSRPPGGINLGEHVAAIRASVHPTAATDYFLARMTYRHLTPTDEAALISMPAGDRHVADVAVALSDAAGERFVVRAPMTPREVARLLQLFHDSNLPVAFAGEHEFLVAIDAKETIIGGLFYRMLDERRAHLEKIVVDRRHRRKGVSDGLMNEFMRRLRGRGVRVLETGFFHPQYMLRFGFRTEPHYGGLYRELGVEAPA